MKIGENRNLYRNLYTRYSGYSVGRTVNGVNFTHYPDGRVLVNGTAEKDFKYVIGTVDNPKGYDRPMYLRTNPAFTAYPSGFCVTVFMGNSRSGSYTTDNGNSKERILNTAGSTLSYGVMYVQMNSGVTVERLMLYPYVSSAELPTEYTYLPYGGYPARMLSNDFMDFERLLTDIVNSRYYTKNILKLIKKTETINGITFTIDPENGRVAVSGAAEGDATCLIAKGISVSAADLYRICGSDTGADSVLTDSRGFLSERVGSNSLVMLASPGLGSYTSDFYLTIRSGKTFSWQDYIYPMITKGYVLDDRFVAYQEPSGSHVLKKTLRAGNMSVVFTSDQFSDESILDFYTSNGAQYKSASFDGNGKVTVVFPIQEEDIEVIVRW